MSSSAGARRRNRGGATPTSPPRSEILGTQPAGEASQTQLGTVQDDTRTQDAQPHDILEQSSGDTMLSDVGTHQEQSRDSAAFPVPRRVLLEDEHSRRSEPTMGVEPTPQQLALENQELRQQIIQLRDLLNSTLEAQSRNPVTVAVPRSTPPANLQNVGLAEPVGGAVPTIHQLTLENQALQRRVASLLQEPQ